MNFLISLIVFALLSMFPSSALPSQFISVEELQAFLILDQTNKIEDPNWDCDDYALALQHNALRLGKVLNIQLLGSSESLHMVNLAVIGNKLIFIEPKEDRIFDYGRLDIGGDIK